MRKKTLALILALMLALSLGACAVRVTDLPAEPAPEAGGDTADSDENTLLLTVNGQEFTVQLEDNAAAKALVQQLPLTLTMEQLNGNEKYATLPAALPKDEKAVGQITTGDLMLYGDDCLVLFYRDFATEYSYTRLGHLADSTGLFAAVGSGVTQVTLASAEQQNPQKTTEDALYESILLQMGAEFEDGVLRPRQPSIYYTYYDGGFADGSKLDPFYYYAWFLGYSRTMGIPYDEYVEQFASPFQEYGGWAFPADVFESTVNLFFGVTAEELRQSDLYYPEYDCYWSEPIGGRGECPELEVYSAEQEGKTLTLHLSLIYDRIHVPANNVFMTLTVRLTPEGTWQYLSYLPEENVTTEQRESVYRSISDTPTPYGVPYRSTDYGFTLNLPADWAGRYSVQETTLYYTDGDEYVPSLCFHYQDDVRSPLFWVCAVPLEQKELFQAECPDYVWAGENSRYGFAIRDASDWENPYRGGSSSDYKWCNTLRLPAENLAKFLTVTEPAD